MCSVAPGNQNVDGCTRRRCVEDMVPYCCTCDAVEYWRYRRAGPLARPSNHAHCTGDDAHLRSQASEPTRDCRRGREGKTRSK
ncbi:hypothetical protein GMOD_00003255 [Pyrenophora seminiperda CCB06]|uniref:Uncharacterized protein n=1 Tax=Pyrenophora seminiperda CCB06 TaxID=1302712 RepID=A0A3M7MIR0_9PLEO|nr:hypothetical protein GMOD_00003255 [Pyrenophora seminiperda CCB06]